MTPFGLHHLDMLAVHMPNALIARERVVLVRVVKPKTLSNYGTGLLRFTQFCEALVVPESLQILAPEWLLSVFITMRGAGAIRGGMLRTWLLSLQLWHVVNGAPWHGAAHLKRALQGSKSVTPATSSCTKCALVTITHLQALRHNLNLNDTFDTAVFRTATVAFWCQCQLCEVCVDSSFDPQICATNCTHQRSGTTTSNVSFHSFWAPSTKTCPGSEEIRWIDSKCLCSAEWAFQNHWAINLHFPNIYLPLKQSLGPSPP